MRDFDAAWKEKTKPPVAFKAYGREFTLPPHLPALVPLRVQSIQDKRGGLSAMTAAEVDELAPLVIGREAYDHLIQSGASLEQLGDVIMWAVEQYVPQEERREGNPPAPAGAG